MNYRYFCLIIALFALALGGCVAPSPPPKAEDGYDVIVVSDERGQRVRSNIFANTALVYHFARGQLQYSTGGKLYPLPEPDVLKILEKAGVISDSRQFAVGLPGERSRATVANIAVRTHDVDAILPVAKAYGVRFLIMVHDGFYDSFDAKIIQHGRVPLIGGLGWEYRQPDNFMHHKAGLTYSFWDCVTGKRVTRATTQVEGSMAIWKRGELWPKFGMALVQRVQPSATSAVKNPRLGDYTLWPNVSASARHWPVNPVDSGIVVMTANLRVVQLERQGDWVELTTTWTNNLDAPMDYSFDAESGQAFCIDVNRSIYPVTFKGRENRGYLRPGQQAKMVLRVQVEDRNVDFINLHLPLRSRGGNWSYDATLSVENIPLF